MKQLFFLLLLIPLVANAIPPAWKIVPAESEITFTATQNNSPVSGNFKKFEGEINFDPDQLKESHIGIIIDMNSVNTSYSDVAATLKTPEWFNVKLFPQAIFKANTFTKIGDQKYQAEGTLTLRDKTIPVTLLFELTDYSSHDAKAKGSAQLKRTQFGVGTGEWAKTDEIKDTVAVNFIIKAKK